MQLAFLVVVGALWLAFATLMSVVRSRWPSACRALDKFNISASPVSISGSTGWGMDALLRTGVRHARSLHAWFSLGVRFFYIGFAAALALLLYNIVQPLVVAISWLAAGAPAAAPAAGPQVTLSLAIPGLTLPWQQMGYLWLAVFVSVLVHELGHALAAASYQVPTKRLGVFCFLFFPGAFVELDEDSPAYTRLSPRQMMHITCAGVWHNVALCVVLGVAVLLVPWALAPLYRQGAGAVVLEAHQALLPLAGLLVPGARIVSVDGSPVGASRDWQQLVEAIASAPQAGYCIGNHVLATEMAALGSDCCNASHPDAASYQCFQRMGDAANDDVVLADLSVCMSARKNLVMHREAVPRCSGDSAFHADLPAGCGEYASCMLPVPQSPDERLVTVAQFGPSDRGDSSTDNGGDLMVEWVFAGNPRELLYGVRTTDWAPRAGVCVLGFPDVLYRALLFTMSVSASLAILNSAPIHLADGALSLEAWLSWALPHWAPRKRKRWLQVLLNTGTGLVVCNVIVALIQSVTSHVLV